MVEHDVAKASDALPLSTRARQWVSGWSGATKVCVGVIASIWLLRTLAAMSGWYIEDDFLFKYNAATEPLSLDYLFRSHYGNIMPGALALEWVRVRYISAEFWSAAIISGVAYAASSILLMSILRRWVRSSTAIVVAVIWFSVVLISAETQFWWAAALNGGLMLPFALGSVYCAIKYVEGGIRKDLVLSGLLMVIALLFFQKGITIAVWALLALWVFRTLRPDAAPELRKRLVTVVSVACGISALYLVLFLTLVSVGGNAEFGINITVAVFAGIWQLLSTSAVGGPWSWWVHADGNVGAAPTVTGVIIAAEVCVVFIIAVMWVRRRALILFAAGFVAVAFSTFVLLVGRAADPLDPFGADRALDLRYSADLIAPLAVILALCLSGAHGERKVWTPAAAWLRSRLPATTHGRHLLLFVPLNIFVVSALISWSGYVSPWAANEGGDWAGAAAREINKLDPSITLVNQPVPDSVRKRKVSEYSRAQQILTPFVPAGRWVNQSPQLTVVDTYGFVGPGYIEGAQVFGPAKGCGWNLKPGQSATANLPLPIEHKQWLVQVSYLSGEQGFLNLQLGDGGIPSIVDVSSGLADTFTTLEGGGATLKMTNQTTSNVCVSYVRVGVGKLLTPPKF